MFKKIGIAGIIGAAIALVGCSDAPTEQDVRQMTLNQLNGEKEQLNNIQKTLNNIDPTIIGADFNINSSGEKVIEIHRSDGIGNVITSVLTKQDTDKLLASNTQQEKEANKPSSATDNSFVSGFAGGMTGAILGNMLSNSLTSSRNSNEFSNYRSNQRANYNSSVSRQNMAIANSKGFSGSSRGGSFSSGARSSSFGG